MVCEGNIIGTATKNASGGNAIRAERYDWFSIILFIAMLAAFIFVLHTR